MEDGAGVDEEVTGTEEGRSGFGEEGHGGDAFDAGEVGVGGDGDKEAREGETRVRRAVGEHEGADRLLSAERARRRGTSGCWPCGALFPIVGVPDRNRSGTTGRGVRRVPGVKQGCSQRPRNASELWRLQAWTDTPPPNLKAETPV